MGEVAAVRQGRAGRGGRRGVLEVVIADGGAVAALVWFHQITYFARRFRTGQRLLVHGRVEPPLGGGPRRIIHPDVTPLDGEEDAAGLAQIVPVYEKPTTMAVGAMRRLVHTAVEELAGRVPSVLPRDVVQRHRLIDLGRALRHVHTPAPEADVQGLSSATSLAHRALVFDELFFLQLGLALRRSAAGREPGTAFPPSTRLVPGLRRTLPFTPTGAQERAFAEIAADLAEIGRAHV